MFHCRYGGWSWALEPYWKMNLTYYFEHPKFDSLASIIDPYAYRCCTIMYCTVLYCTVLYCTVQGRLRRHQAVAHRPGDQGAELPAACPACSLHRVR